MMTPAVSNTLAALPSALNRFLLYLAVLTPLFIAFAPRGMAVLLVLAAVAFGALACSSTLRQARAEPNHTRPRFKALLAPLAALLLLTLSAFYSDSPRAFEMLRDVVYVSLATGALYYASFYWPATISPRFTTVFAVAFLLFLLLFTVNLLADFPFQRLTGNVPDDGRSIFESNVPKRSAALFAIFMWPVALALWLQHKRRAAWGLLALATLLSFLFNSSTAMLASVAGLAVLGCSLLRVRIGQSLGLVLMPLGFVLMLVLALSVPNLPAPLSNAIKDSGDYRLQIWNFVGRNTLDHLPFGIGLDGSRVLPSNGEYADFVPPDGTPIAADRRADILPDHPHNFYLQIWLELGVLGVLLAMLLSWQLWRRLCALPARVQPLVWGYVITAVITLAIAYGAWQAWWLAGHGLCAVMVAALARTYQEEN